MFFHVMFLRKNQAWVCLVFSSHLFPQIERTGLILSSDDKQAYFTSLLLALECHPSLPNTAFRGGGRRGGGGVRGLLLTDQRLCTCISGIIQDWPQTYLPSIFFHFRKKGYYHV